MCIRDRYCSSLKDLSDDNDNDWINLPINYCDVPKDSFVSINIYQCDGASKMQATWGTSVSLFDSNTILCIGVHQLKMIKNEVVTSNLSSDDLYDKGMFEVMKCLRKYHNGEMIKVSWLDRLTFTEVNRKRKSIMKNDESVYLTVEFPKFFCDNQPVLVVYCEDSNDDVIQVNFGSDIVKYMDTETCLLYTSRCV